jgi:hypothetical protein
MCALLIIFFTRRRTGSQVVLLIEAGHTGTHSPETWRGRVCRRRDGSPEMEEPPPLPGLLARDGRAGGQV